MGNIVSYLRWRGDLSFWADPFNEVDNLILSYLSYFDFSGIVPGIDENQTLSVRKAAGFYFQSTRKDNPFIEQEFLRVIAETRRFGDILLWKYEDIGNTENEKTQFAALHMILNDGTEYISFRGTDNSITGWREDFGMSYETVPAQKKAVEYLKKTIPKNAELLYRVGGHSKGGNLAAYGVMMCEERIQERVIQIYMNDSPGFCPAMLDEVRFSAIESKIIKIVPAFSVIGMLFEKEAPKKIVRSNVEGIMQHDAITWQVDGNHFRYAEELTEKSKVYNEIFDHWIESADMEQRKTFTTDFFDALEAGGASTMMEVVKGGADEFEAVLYAMLKSHKDSKKAVGQLIGSFFEEAGKISFSELFRKKKALRGAAEFAVGAMFIIMPGIALNLIGTAFFLWLLLFSFSRIRETFKKKESWKTADKIKIVFYSFVAALEMLCILFNNIIVVSANLVLGFFFGWRSYRQVKNAAVQRKRGKKRWLLSLLEAVFACILALVVLAKSGEGMEVYILAAGTYLTIGGMAAIGSSIFEETKNDN